MSRNLLPLLILLGSASMPLPAQAFELKSVKIDLPDSDKMFEGPGPDAINNNCLACHSAGMVLNQPALSKQAWTAEDDQQLQGPHSPGGRRCDRRIFDCPQVREIDAREAQMPAISH